MIRSHVLICGGTGCTSSGSEQLIGEFEAQLAANGLEKEVKNAYMGNSKSFNPYYQPFKIAYNCLIINIGVFGESYKIIIRLSNCISA